MSRITRKELKTDKFALEVEHTVSFFDQHRKEAVRYGGILLAVVLLVGGYMMFSRRQHAQREEALAHALQVHDATIATPANTAGIDFPTREAKVQAELKEFGDIASKYKGSSEGQIAEYYLASVYADEGKLAEAEAHFKAASDSGDDKYRALAKLSLAQIYFADGRASQGEALLRDMMEHPSAFVSKDVAALTLAENIKTTKPDEARKLVQPLVSVQGAVGQMAISLSGELGTK